MTDERICFISIFSIFFYVIYLIISTIRDKPVKPFFLIFGPSVYDAFIILYLLSKRKGGKKLFRYKKLKDITFQ